MKLYWQIAFKYLRYNVRRTVVTLVGVIISASFMFGILNTMFCSLNDERRNVRLMDGYEAIFYDVSKSQLEEMVRDYNVEKYEIKDYQEPLMFDEELRNEKPTVHKNAGWVKFKHPYFMRLDYKKICKKMGVEGELNEYLASLYDLNLYDKEGDVSPMLMFFLLGLLACYLTGGFAVLVTKNTLKLSVMEKIRDYGVLRCIGTSLKQLRKIVVKEAVIMAIPSAFIGSIFGYLLMKSTVELLDLNITVTFSFEAFVVMLVALLCSMYFSAIDPCKMIKGITPVMAMNRQLKLPKKERKLSEKKRLAKEKRYEKKQERKRKKAEKNWTKGKNGFSLYGRLFGIEGEYAYKSMKRNRKQYYGTLFAFSASVIVFIVVAVMGAVLKDYGELVGGYDSIYNITLSSFDVYGIPIHPIHQYSFDDIYMKPEEIDSVTIKQLQKEKAVKGCKELRVANMYESDSKRGEDIYTKEFLTKSNIGRMIDRLDISNLAYMNVAATFQTAIIEEDDISDYEKDLLEGTVRPEELSDNGIVLVNQGIFYDDDDDYGLGSGQERKHTITKYRLGDTITFYDLPALMEEVQKGMDKREKETEGKDKKTAKKDKEAADGDDTSKAEEDEEIDSAAYWDIVKVAQETLRQQGKTREYVVEGILSRDRSGHISTTSGTMILTKESTFYDMTGMDKERIQGYRIALDLDASSSDISRVSNLVDSLVIDEIDEDYDEGDEAKEDESNVLFYGEGLVQAMMKESIEQTRLVLIAIVVILFSVSCINILNSNASSIFLRKSELAQMRVIGMSKKRLVKMLALEGCIMAAAATIIGTVIGIAISYGVIRLLKVMILELTYRFPLLAIVVVFLVTVAIMIISTAIPVAGLHNDLVEDMAVEE